MVKNRRVNPWLTLFLCLFPLQWVKIMPVAGGSVKAAHLALLIPPIALLMMKKITLPKGGFTNILVLHPLLFGTLLLTLPFSENPGAGMQIIIRMSAYYVVGVMVVVWLNSMTTETLRNTLSDSIFYVTIVFGVVFSYYVILSGVNVFNIFLAALSSGDPNFVQYHLFVTVMNKGRLEEFATEDNIEAAGRHGIMIFLIFILFSRTLMKEGTESRLKSNIGSLLVVAILIFVFVSLSRVSILIVACAAMMVFANRVLSRKAGYLTYAVVGIGVVSVLMYLLFGQHGAIATLLYEKLFLDVLNNPRVYEFIQIIDQINQRPIIGAGTGTELELFGLSAKYPHNVVLFWWYQSGIVGLLVSLMTLIVFIGCCLRLWYLSMKCKDQLIGNIYLLAGIFLISPIIRMMVAKQGALALTEWIAIAFAITLANLGWNLERRITPKALAKDTKLEYV